MCDMGSSNIFCTSTEIIFLLLFWAHLMHRIEPCIQNSCLNVWHSPPSQLHECLRPFHQMSLCKLKQVMRKHFMHFLCLQIPERPPENQGHIFSHTLFMSDFSFVSKLLILLTSLNSFKDEVVKTSDLFDHCWACTSNKVPSIACLQFNAISFERKLLPFHVWAT